MNKQTKVNIYTIILSKTDTDTTVLLKRSSQNSWCGHNNITHTILCQIFDIPRNNHGVAHHTSDSHFHRQLFDLPSSQIMALFTTITSPHAHTTNVKNLNLSQIFGRRPRHITVCGTMSNIIGNNRLRDLSSCRHK